MSTANRSTTSPKPQAAASASGAPSSSSSAAGAGATATTAQGDNNKKGGQSGTGAGGDVSHAWEATDSQHVWEGVREDEDGNIIVREGDSLVTAIRKRRKRQVQNDYSQRNRRVVRDMIRYLYVVVDASRWMRQKDPALPPGTRLDVTTTLLQQFVNEYYDQNPLSHLGFVVCQHGECEIVAPLSSSSAKTHKLSLQSIAELALSQGPASVGGEFSLQNGLEVAGRSLGHQPKHGSREIVLLTSALTTCDPGSILTETLPKLKRSKVRVSCYALTAEMHVCRKIAEETGGTMGVCLDKSHYKEWLFQQCVPPPTMVKEHDNKNGGSDGGTGGLRCEMIPMGFPTRMVGSVPSLVHDTRTTTLLARTSYVCPQCQAKNSSLPVDCAVCGLKLVLAPHLARSFHHLFPVSAFLERPFLINRSNDSQVVGSSNTTTMTPVIPSSGIDSSSEIINRNNLNSKLLVSSEEDDETCCYSCLKPLSIFETVSDLDDKKNNKNGGGKKQQQQEEEGGLLRFQCPDCNNYFCVDCDAYLHETLHNCPGCLCLL